MKKGKDSKHSKPSNLVVKVNSKSKTVATQEIEEEEKSPLDRQQSHNVINDEESLPATVEHVKPNNADRRASMADRNGKSSPLSYKKLSKQWAQQTQLIGSMSKNNSQKLAKGKSAVDNVMLSPVGLQVPQTKPNT